jgi:hypothetical protein
VRIYHRRVQYLEADARAAIDGLARRAGGGRDVDLPDGGTAPAGAITLAEPEPPSRGGTSVGGGLFPNGAAELFPTFHVADLPAGFGGGAGGGASSALFGGGRADGVNSLTLAEDVSDVFGSRWTASEDRFDAAGDDLDRRFSAELERLRSQAAADGADADGAPFYDDGDDGGAGGSAGFGGGADGLMPPPPAGTFELGGGAGPTPGSTGGGALPGGADGRFTPPSLGAMPDLDMADYGGGGEDGGGEDEDEGGDGAGTARQRARAAAPRRRRPTLDVDEGGAPATTLSTLEIRQLLDNRAPLLRARGLDAAALAAAGPPAGPYDVRAQSEAARESFLYRPAAFDRLAPELLALFLAAAGVAEDGRLPGARARRRGAAAAAELAGADGAAPMDADGASLASEGRFSGGDGGGDFGGGSDDDGLYSEPEGIEGSPALGEDGPGPGARPGSLSLAGRAASEGLLEEEDAPVGAAAASDGFTARTRAVAAHLRAQLAPAPGGKRARGGAPVGGAAAASLDALVAGRSRLDACRWFFEALVLRTKGFVDLEQPEPYGDIAIRALAPLFDDEAPAAVGAGGVAAPPARAAAAAM